jgi:succinate dehydrogenase / fumarate reductase cytochrome b subunit
VLLYAGGPIEIFPNETYFLKDIVEAKIQGDLPEDLQILFRCHPIDKLAVHLRHAFRSAFQSLGANHPHLNPILEKAGIVAAIVFGLGFASFPLVFLMTRGGS